MIRIVTLSALAQAFFILLFPCLFFYSSAVGAGLMPAVLGGGFGVVAAAAFLLLFPYVLGTLSRRRGTPLYLTLAFLTLLLYTAVWFGAHVLFGDDVQRSPDVAQQWVSLLASWAALFSIGYFWPAQIGRRARQFLAVSLGGMAAITILQMQGGPSISSMDETEAAHLTYQGLARSAAFTGLALLAACRRAAAMWSMTILLVVTVFLIGARSELVALVAILPLIVYGEYRRHPGKSTVAILAAVPLILGLAVHFQDVVADSRHMGLLSLNEDSSWTARRKLQQEAEESIMRNPLFGDFAGHTRTRDGDVGHYAHNVFSAWRQLGVVGFALYVALLAAPALLALRQFRLYPWDPMSRFAAFLSLFILVLLLGAKPLFWPFPAFVWGLAVATHERRSLLRSALANFRAPA